MYRIKETVVVEGTYDKIKLSRFLDGVIFVTGGFSIMSSPERIKTLQVLTEKTGAVIFTDSDSAGFRIRNFLKQKLPGDMVKHAYIPDVYGKEKRKREPGKEGLLGVEGIQEDILLQALKTAGCTIDGTCDIRKRRAAITKADFYAFGLSGRPDSRAKRYTLCKTLGLPMKVSSNMLLDVLNRLMDRDEFQEFLSHESDLG